MTDRRLAPEKERAAAVAALAEMLKTMSFPEIGKALGCSGEAVRKAVKNGEIGPRVVRLTADYLHVSLEGLVERYGTAESAPPDMLVRTVTEVDDRYPSRARVARQAREEGVDEGAIADLLGENLQAAEDPGRPYWERLLLKYESERKGFRDALKAHRAKPQDVEVVDDDDRKKRGKR